MTEVELCSALASKTRTGNLGLKEAHRVLETFRRHVKAKGYEVLPVSRELFSLASSLPRFETALKAPDALHLACCQFFELTLLTADDGLARGAAHFGVPHEHLKAV